MRKLWMVLGLMASLNASAADRGEAQLPSLEELLRASSDPRHAEALGSRALFFVLPDAAAHEVRFAVTVGGKPYLEETVVTPAATLKEQPAVEFLARDPQRLERLYSLAANKVLPVRVEVTVDRRAPRVFDFDAFVAYNRALKIGGLRPVAGESTLRVQAVEPAAAQPERAAAAPQPDGPCEDQCWWNYQNCMNNCSSCPTCPIPLGGELPYPGDCSYCDSEYNYCLASCPPPCNPGDIIGETTYTESELVAINGSYWECLKRWWNPDPTWGEWFQWTQWVYKVTTYKRTTYCGGSTSTTVLSVTYSSFYCQYPMGGACYYPWSTAWQACF